MINELYTIEPLVIDLNKYTKEPTYRINQRKGGPYIDISYYRGFANDSNIPYQASYLDYYARFIHFDNYDEFKASAELKEYYNTIAKFIKSKCKVVKKNDKTYLIGLGALEEIKW